jgi:hypothetical protein
MELIVIVTLMSKDSIGTLLGKWALVQGELSIRIVGAILVLK